MRSSTLTKQSKSCLNCIHGTKVQINSDVICMINGAVSYDFFCKKHKFIPAKLSGDRAEFKCIDCEHFILSSSDTRKASKTTGVCHLFSVRECDGSTKKACSKFSPNRP